MTRDATTAGSGRARRALRIALVLLLLLGLLAVAGVTWLLRGSGGRDYALARVLAELPAGSLQWRQAEGTLAGPLRLHDVRFEHDGVVLEVDMVEIDLAPGDPFARRIRIERLELQRGRLQLPPAIEDATPWPAELRLPESLPALELPFALQVDQLLAADVQVARGTQPLLHLQRLRASVSHDAGRWQLPQLELETDRGWLRASGELDLAADWRTDLRLAGELTTADAAPLPFQLRLRGVLHDLTLQARVALEQPATLTAHLTGGLAAPRWSLLLAAPEVAPQRFGGEGEPFALAVQGGGDLQQAALQGYLQRGETRLVLAPSQLRYAGAALQLQPLVLELDAGRLTLRGKVDLQHATPRYELQLSSDAWRVSAGAAGAEAVDARFQAQLQGLPEAYSLQLDATLRRGRQNASVTLSGEGDRRQLRVDALRVQLPGGALQGKGRLGWDPEPSWQLDATLDDFDPSWLLADFPGAVDAHLVSEGSVTPAGPRGSVLLDPLGGSLRGRALAGRVDAAIDATGQGEARIDVHLGESHLVGEGRWSGTIEATLALQPLRLADVWPDMAGTVRGDLRLSGVRQTPAIRAQLEGEALAGFGLTVERARLSAGRDAGGTARLSLRAQSLGWGEQKFERLALDASGQAAAHQLSVQLAGEPATLALRLDGGGDAHRWQGMLRQLQITPKERAPWQLRAPVALRWDRDAGTVALAPGCLSDGAAALCAQIAHDSEGSVAQATLEALPLASLDPFLAAQFDLPVNAFGSLTGDARLQRAAGGEWRGRLRLRSKEGGLRLDPAAPRELLGYRDFTLDAALEPQRGTLVAAAQIGKDGTLRFDLESATPLAEDGALAGELALALRDLTPLELWSDRIVTPRGAIDANLAIGGRRGAPTFDGQAVLRDFEAELPELGVNLREGGLRLRSRGTPELEVAGEVTSGGGTLQLSGTLGFPPDAPMRAELRLQGENFAAAGLPELGAVVAPDLTLSLRDEKMKLRGSITVPSANLNLEHLQGATAPSSDAVIVDAEAAAAGEDLLLDSDVDLILGEKVRLRGFGLKGRLEGRIAVRERPGRATVARGALQVTGEYKAYGQNLDITRGRLSYAATPLDDPALDIRAEREIDEDVTVGVRVRGTALAPELTLWSKPPLDQAEQLSYLVLGRPMSSATQADGARLSQAAAAFGGNLLAQKLGARMGLDEVGVSDSRVLGGAALTVGKFLSPKLYVSYGVALFGTGQIVTFKYLLSRAWSVQIDSGSENRAAINYRLER